MDLPFRRARGRGLDACGREPRFASAANLPVGSLGATPAAQGEYGTIRGRLVWGGSDVSSCPGADREGTSTKGPGDLRPGSGDSQPRAGRRSQDQGRGLWLCLPGQAQGLQPGGCQGAAGQEPEGGARSKELRVLALCPGHSSRPNIGDQVQRPRQSQCSLRRFRQCAVQPDHGSERGDRGEAGRRAAADRRGLRHSFAG